MEYSDDIVFFTKGNNVPILINKINSAIETISKWISDNRVALSPGKSKAILFTKEKTTSVSKYKRTFEEKFSAAVKYLSMILDRNLNWN